MHTQTPRIRFAQPRASTFPCPQCSNKHYMHLKGLAKHCREKGDALHQEVVKTTSAKYCRFCGNGFKRPCERSRHERFCAKPEASSGSGKSDQVGNILSGEQVEASTQHPSYNNIGSDLSYECSGILLEVIFNESTSPRYTVPYDSPIFICVQSGDIHGAQSLFQEDMASIYDVDPYGLGLLYYASYYCWRSNGAISAIPMCRMLIQIGADMNIMDEIGNTPIHTMTDSALAERCRDLNSPALVDVGLLYDMSSYELVEYHQSSSNLTTLHKTLLKINPGNTSLREHLHSLQSLGSLAELIDKPDSRGRTALAWAVEYGMADSVRTLLSFGANACQYRQSPLSQLPLLHLVIAGPPPPLTSGLLEVVKILLATEININARDNEGWSAWHVAASWRSYNILDEIIHTHGTCVELDSHTNNGILAHELSQDRGFYQRLLPNWHIEC